MSQSSPIFPTQSLAAGFKTDLDKVVKKFSATDCVRYEVFAEIWREMKLNFLCAGRQTEREARELMEMVFEMTSVLWFPPSPFQTRVCALYMLYGLYCTQPCQPRVKIRLTASQWTQVLNFMKTLEEQHHLDVIFILNKLRAIHAFHFVATKNEHFPQSKEAEPESDRSKDPMKEVEESLIRDIINADLLEQIEALHTQYYNVKCSLAGPGAEQPDRSLNLLNGNIILNIKNILQRFEGRRKARYQNPGHSSSGDSSESDPEFKLVRIFLLSKAHNSMRGNTLVTSCIHLVCERGNSCFTGPYA
ncbi:snRNA-activating protein complex subunit 1-like [Liolophura sinensis]|uniref:snRNA-activating protein complex subunit 1-like n=1 Tax=Liolophura sinensis TaxID=3198878 RepID=UPI0031585FEF